MKIQLKWVVLGVIALGTMSQGFGAQKTLATGTLRSMARAYMAFGQYEKAYVYAKQALNKSESGQTDAGEKALCLIDMGTVCSYSGDLDSASEYFEKGLALQKEALFDEHPYVAHTMRMLSNVYCRRQQLDKAQSVLAEAIRIMLNNCSIESREMAPFILESAKLQFRQGDLEQAQLNFEKALDIYMEMYGPDHLTTANLQADMAEMYLAVGEFDRADALMKESISTQTRIYGRYHPMLVQSWLSMARICRQNGCVEKSEYYLAKTKEALNDCHNVVTVAEAYEQIRDIRRQKLVASAISGT